ncbi:MAG: hypothetical protein LBB55_04420 [Zoogloeaceae bacterium]|jgi:hypothetical protein|nr:hypothetical protein [Zoogloeaceae bacterium]
MKNITTEISAYREAVRHLWNSTFATLDETLRFGTCLELFEQIDALIFRALVCEPLGIEFKTRASFDPIINLKVIPISPAGIPILVNRSMPASGYWDDSVKTISAADMVELAFIGLFDWDGYNVKDCTYYRVRIIDCKSRPSLIGRDALVETFYVNVFLEPENFIPSPSADEPKA